MALLTLILVDDEAYVISGLLRHLDWASLGVRVAGTACNGQEGLSLIRTLNPDLVLTDIRMPVMDGIQMIRQAAEESHRPEFIILSGYDEFSYAKTAMSFGVEAYLLKPALNEEIATAVRQATEKCLRRSQLHVEQTQLREKLRGFQPMLLASFLDELLRGRIAERAQFEDRCRLLELDIRTGCYAALSLHVDNQPDLCDEETLQYLLCLVVEETCVMFPEARMHTHFKNRFATFLLVIPQGEPCPPDLVRRAGALSRACAKRWDLAISAGLGSWVDAWDSIAQSYEQSTDCLKYCPEPASVRTYEQRLMDGGRKGLGGLYRFQREALLDALKMGRSEQACDCVRACFARMTQLGMTGKQYLRPLAYELVGIIGVTAIQAGVTVADREVSLAANEASLTVEELETHIAAYCAQVARQIALMGTQKTGAVMEQVIRQVEERYASDLSLGEIADALHISPNYLSALFSKGMGESFSTFLTGYRIDRAKQLLGQGVLKVYEVGERVGYHNPDYFSRLFKELVGVSPSEYRR